MPDTRADTRPSTIEFFFDPTCPWTWMTSRWLTDAAGQLGIAIDWRSLSLAVLNADNDVPEKYRAPMAAGQLFHRIIAALRAEDRNDLVGRLYTEWGRQMHQDGVTPSAELVAKVASAAGVGEWAGAADDPAWDAAIEASTAEAQTLAGPDVGSPVLALGEPRRGLFGPIVSPPPVGDEAVELFDHVVALLTQPSFFELKRGRTEGPRFGPRP